MPAQHTKSSCLELVREFIITCAKSKQCPNEWAKGLQGHYGGSPGRSVILTLKKFYSDKQKLDSVLETENQPSQQMMQIIDMNGS
eukprot:scaffold388337_cov19-Prasinocladus_malaysianus.AAC.1